MRAHARVDEHAVDALDAELLEDARRLGVVREHRAEAVTEAREPRPGSIVCFRIAIEREDIHARVEQGLGVSTPAERPIEDERARRKAEVFEHLADHDRRVIRGCIGCEWILAIGHDHLDTLGWFGERLKREESAHPWAITKKHLDDPVNFVLEDLPK